MKKAYVKPQIMFEDFSLTTNIAGDCEVKTTSPGNTTCGMDFSGLVVFMKGMDGCTDIKVEDMGGDGQWNEICYHVPYGDNLFNS